MITDLRKVANPRTRPVSARCPHCKHNGVLTAIHEVHDAEGGQGFAGVRRCPNPECGGVVFFTLAAGLQRTYPPEAIDFDATSLPPTIVEMISEAATCAANECYRAAAIMVRRTLEEVCADKGATGKQLSDRLKSLASIALLSSDLVEALTELRLLGNDAAHVEAREYIAVGEEEVTVALDACKVVLQAVYQYGDVVARMRALKAT